MLEILENSVWLCIVHVEAKKHTFQRYEYLRAARCAWFGVQKFSVVPERRAVFFDQPGKPNQGSGVILDSSQTNCSI